MDNTIMANSILFYDNGLYGERGYATPFITPGKLTTCNRDIKNLVDTFGKLLSGIMQMPDVWVSSAPERIWIETVGRSIDRFRQIVSARMTQDGVNSMRTGSIMPAQEPFMIFPVPYFKVRNPYAKTWAWYAMMALSECMKHSDNTFPLGISATLASLISQYTESIYRQLSIEILGKPPTVPLKVGDPVPAMPTLTSVDYGSYSKQNIFLSVERIDQGAPFDYQLPSEALVLISDGIPATQIYSQLKNPPGSISNSLQGTSGNTGTVDNQTQANTQTPFVPAPPGV